MSTQPPTFGAPPPYDPNQGGQVPQAPPPPPSFGAPPPQQGYQQPGQFAAPPPQYATPAGTPPPPQKKGFNWGLTCLILFIVFCCCCCGVPWGLIATGNEFAKDFADGLSDELRRSGIDTSEWENLDSTSSEDWSTDWTDSSGDMSGGSLTGETPVAGGGVYAGGSEGGRSYEEASTFGTSDLERIGYWSSDHMLDGRDVSNDAGYDSNTMMSWMEWKITSSDGTAVTYRFNLESDGTPIPANDEARSLASQLNLTRKDG